MSTLFDYLNTGDGSADDFKSTKWQAISFVASAAYLATSVKCKWYRFGNGGGTITLGLRATDGASKPTGADLASGTMAAASLTTSSPGLWYEITLGAGTLLAPGTRYSVVCRTNAGDSSNFVQWRWGFSASFDGWYSNDSGVNWTAAPEQMFEVWGEAAGGGGQGGSAPLLIAQGII